MGSIGAFFRFVVPNGFRWGIAIFPDGPFSIGLARAVFELNRRGFPNRQCSDSTCWLGGGQQECQSRIHKICETA